MAEILLGVTGGAAVFKAVALASTLRKSGNSVNCVMTASAGKFVNPVQFSAVTGKPCYTDLFPPYPFGSIPHIRLTDSLDLMVVAPATANFIARAAHGLADDIVTAVFLACEAPVLIAPAMNTRMWNNAAVRANVQILSDRGIRFAGPVAGSLACGTSGEGRMMEPQDIASLCYAFLAEGSMQ